MATCSVRWRSSGGRGEFEYVPADSLEGKEIVLDVEPLGVTIQTEVRGVKAQGKPRLRKFESNNRKKLHLPQLVMAIARLPEPAREDIHGPVVFPLENKSFVMDSMDFEIIDVEEEKIVLMPLRVSILHADYEVDIWDKITSIRTDEINIKRIEQSDKELARLIEKHISLVRLGNNTSEIRQVADSIIERQATIYGMSNAGSASEVIKYYELPESEIESIVSKPEGKLLTRIHSYKERDRAFVKKVKDYYRSKYGGELICNICELIPNSFYGINGERALEAHHTKPIEMIQPDSITRVDEMAIICASCHRIIHSETPCLTVKEVRNRIGLQLTENI